MAAGETTGALFPPPRSPEDTRRPIWLRVFWVMCQCVIDSEYQEPFNEEDYLLPEQPPHLSGRATLVLDLDETLIHSSPEPLPGWDFTVPFAAEEGPQLRYVKKRPKLDLFLTSVSDLFEVIIFTASTQNYASAVIDKIDQNRLIHNRMYRDACILRPDGFIKDLRRLNRDLRKVIIVDVCPTQNTPLAYSLQPANAIPISTWLSDDSDTDLAQLLPLLEQLAEEDDVVQALMRLKEDVKTHRRAFSVMAEMEETAVQEKRCLTDT